MSNKICPSCGKSEYDINAEYDYEETCTQCFEDSQALQELKRRKLCWGV